jgi:hypothetical protein
MYRFAQDNLDVKKVSAPSKTPAKWLFTGMCFSHLKNIKSLTSKNSGILIVNKRLIITYNFFENFKRAEGLQFYIVAKKNNCYQETYLNHGKHGCNREADAEQHIEGDEELVQLDIYTIIILQQMYMRIRQIKEKLWKK